MKKKEKHNEEKSKVKDSVAMLSFSKGLNTFTIFSLIFSTSPTFGRDGYVQKGRDGHVQKRKKCEL